MPEGWTCSRCSTVNAADRFGCSNCGLLRHDAATVGSSAPAGWPGTPTEEPTEPATVEASEPTTTAGAARRVPDVVGEPHTRPRQRSSRAWFRRTATTAQRRQQPTTPLATDPGRLADLRRVDRGRGRHRLVLQCEPLDDRRDHQGGRHDGGGPAGRGLLRPQGPCRERNRGCDGRSVHRRPRVRDVLRRDDAGGEFPAETVFETYVNDNCGPAFGAYVGKPYADSELSMYWLAPTAEGWRAGDHSVQCAVYHARVHVQTKSLKGSNQ